MLDPQKTQMESIPVIFSQNKEYFQNWNSGTWNSGILRPPLADEGQGPELI